MVSTDLIFIIRYSFFNRRVGHNGFSWRMGCEFPEREKINLSVQCSCILYTLYNIPDRFHLNWANPEMAINVWLWNWFGTKLAWDFYFGNLLQQAREVHARTFKLLVWWKMVHTTEISWSLIYFSQYNNNHMWSSVDRIFSFANIGSPVIDGI